MAKLLFSIIIALLSVGTASAAEIFSWVDETGRVNYSDVRPEHGRATAVDLNTQALTTVGDSGLRADEKFMLQQLEERTRLEMQTRLEQAAQAQPQPQPQALVTDEPEYTGYQSAYLPYYPSYRRHKRFRYRQLPYGTAAYYRHQENGTGIGIGIGIGYSGKKHGSHGANKPSPEAKTKATVKSKPKLSKGLISQHSLPRNAAKNLYFKR